MDPERPAGMARRVAAKITDAFLINWLAACVASALIVLNVGPDAWDPEQNSATTVGLLFDFFLVVSGPLLFLAIQTACLRGWGATPGKMIWSLEVVDVDRRGPRLSTCLARTLAEFPSALMLGLGYAMAFWDPSRRTWHDVVTRTDVRPATRTVWTVSGRVLLRPMVGGALAGVMVVAGILVRIPAPQLHSWSQPAVDRHIWAGVRAGARGDNKAALEAYSRAIEADPRSSLAYANRGSIYGDMGDLANQIQDCTKALELDSTQVWALLGLGSAYGEMGDRTRSSVMYSRVIELRPDWSGLVYAYRGRGSNHFRGGRFDLAEADFRRGVEIANANYLGTSDFQKGIGFMRAIAMCEEFQVESLRRMDRAAGADSVLARSTNGAFRALGDSGVRDGWKQQWLGVGQGNPETAAPASE